MKDKQSFFSKLTGRDTSRKLHIDEDDDYEEDEDAIDWDEVGSYPVRTQGKHTPAPARNVEIRDEDGEIYDEDTNEDGELSVDVYENDRELIIEAMIAGVKPEDLQVSITRDMVTISGKREANKTVSKENYYHQELYWGTFSRTIMLPHEIDVDQAEAIEKHGMLIIRMPKTDKNRQQKIKVKSI